MTRRHSLILIPLWYFYTFLLVIRWILPICFRDHKTGLRSKSAVRTGIITSQLYWNYSFITKNTQSFSEFHLCFNRTYYYVLHLPWIPRPFALYLSIVIALFVSIQSTTCYLTPNTPNPFYVDSVLLLLSTTSSLSSYQVC